MDGECSDGYTIYFVFGVSFYGGSVRPARQINTRIHTIVLLRGIREDSLPCVGNMRAVVIFHTVLNMSFGLAYIRWTSLGTCP